MQPTLTRDRFVELASGSTIVPVGVEVMADTTTPVSVFERLVGDEDGFLLESVEGGERWGRWSFIGWDPAFTLSSRDGATMVDHPDVVLAAGSPLDVLDDVVEGFSVP